MLKHSVGIVAPVQRQRVEHVAEHAGLQKSGDLTAAEVDVAVGEKPLNALSQCGVRFAVEVVARLETGERSQPPRQVR
jgi:hypothetical protein